MMIGACYENKHPLFEITNNIITLVADIDKLMGVLMAVHGLYRHCSEVKRATYEKHGSIKGKNLIVSEDKLSGSIDSQAIRALIKTYLI